jgi:hypothetical protein
MGKIPKWVWVLGAAGLVYWFFIRKPAQATGPANTQQQAWDAVNAQIVAAASPETRAAVQQQLQAADAARIGSTAAADILSSMEAAGQSISF